MPTPLPPPAACGPGACHAAGGRRCRSTSSIPFDFPGADRPAARAVEAERATAALKERLAGEGVTAIYANDNHGVWQSDFHSLVSACLGMEGPAGVARLLYPQAGDRS